MPYTDPDKKREANRRSSKRFREKHPQKAKAASRKWRKDNIAKTRIYERNRRCKKYGITPKDFERMFEEQSGKCAICRFEFGDIYGDQKTAPRIDHCHETDRVRGLLCQTCNRALGLFKDDETILETAIWYLTK